MNVTQFVLNAIQDTLNKPVSIDKSFLVLGGESFEASKIIGIINNHYHIKLKIKDIFDNEYIDKIIECVESKVQEIKP
jgi:hypothetical protein